MANTECIDGFVNFPPTKPEQLPLNTETSPKIIKVESSILPGTFFLGSIVAAIGLAVFGCHLAEAQARERVVVEPPSIASALWYATLTIVTISAVVAAILYTPPATVGLALMGLMV